MATVARLGCGRAREKGRAREASESGESEQLGAPFLPLDTVLWGRLWSIAPCGGQCLRAVGDQGRFKLAIMG